MSKCRSLAIACTLCISMFLVMTIIAIAMASTVLKPQKPETHVLDVHLQNFKATLGPSMLSVVKASINVTLAVAFSIQNPNSVSMKYSESFTSVLYHDEEVAMVPIPAGLIEAKSTEIINTTLSLYADKVLSDSNLVEDVLSGSLPFYTVTNLSGRIKLFNLISRHIRISSQCSFSIAVSNASIQKTQCHNSVKL